MNHSKTGLNEPFYKWLDEVRRAIRKEKELKEKLAYYNVKLIGYKGVTYDRIGSAGTGGSEKDLYYWMDRIHAMEIEISSVRIILATLKLLEEALSEDEHTVLTALIHKTSISDVESDCTRSYRYQRIDRIVMKWMKMESIS